jgi:hypothetical protein
MNFKNHIMAKFKKYGGHLLGDADKLKLKLEKEQGRSLLKGNPKKYPTDASGNRISDNPFADFAVTIAGKGSDTPIRDRNRLVAEHGGNKADWAKISTNTAELSKRSKAPVEMHAYKNTKTNKTVEIKEKKKSAPKDKIKDKPKGKQSEKPEDKSKNKIKDIPKESQKNKLEDKPKDAKLNDRIKDKPKELSESKKIRRL